MKQKILDLGIAVLLSALLGVSFVNVMEYQHQEQEFDSDLEEVTALYQGNIPSIGNTVCPETMLDEPHVESTYSVVTVDLDQYIVSDITSPISDSDSADTTEPTSQPEMDAAADTPSAADSTAASSSAAGGLNNLHAVNPDCIAWITIPGTVIDYPVMYRPSSKDYYLHRNFRKQHSNAGSLYIAEICRPDSSDNTIIYGHHMSSGKMFASLVKYKSEAFYKKHAYIDLDTLHGKERYQIMYAFVSPVYTGQDFTFYGFANAANADEFNRFLAECSKRSFYNTGVTAAYGDRLLTLSTCEYSVKNGRMVVVAKRISVTPERNN